jgi:hypothetical protein
VGIRPRLRMIGVVAVAACVGACARTWVRPGANAADLDREKFECQFEVSKVVANDLASSAAAVAIARSVQSWPRRAGAPFRRRGGRQPVAVVLDLMHQPGPAGGFAARVGMQGSMNPSGRSRRANMPEI